MRAKKNDLNLSTMIQKISDDKKIQFEIFRMKEYTYYSATIPSAHYSNINAIYYKYIEIKNSKI